MAGSNTTFDRTIRDAIAGGLGKKPKSLPSWLFYDEAGDQIFQQIMRMPEYYPTRCEYDILQHYKDDLLHYFRQKNPTSFRMIELGAGDGLKTSVLLKHFLEKETAFTYLPVDISESALAQLTNRIMAQWPHLPVEPLNKNYDDALASLRDSQEKKVILFMGANIGNFTTADAAQFLKKLKLPLSSDDMLLIGFDLKKDPRVIREAYDDPHGLTARFNLNILHRLNREMGAEFEVENFSHFPYYDPQTGTTKSFLISMKEQSVYIEALGTSVRFLQWEPVHTEISQKYDVATIEKLMALTGLNIIEIFYDSQHYFCDVLLKPR